MRPKTPWMQTRNQSREPGGAASCPCRGQPFRYDWLPHDLFYENYFTLGDELIIVIADLKEKPRELCFHPMRIMRGLWLGDPQPEDVDDWLRVVEDQS